MSTASNYYYPDYQDCQHYARYR